MSDIGSLYVTALNSSMPVILLIVIGLCSALLKNFPAPSYPNLSALAFKICLPIMIIYIFTTQKLSTDDLLIVAAILITSLLSLVIIIPFTFMFPKQQRKVAFACLL